MKRRNLPKYVSAFVRRSGGVRYQYRRGTTRYYFKSHPWSQDFMAEYQACESGEMATKPGERKVKPRSLSALINAYYGSAGYQNLAESTQGVYRRIMESIRDGHGDKRVVKLQRRHIVAMVEKKATTPHAANRLLKLLRLLMKYALLIEWIDRDPTHGVSFLPTHGTGIHVWTEKELEKFIACHPRGTKPHLAMTIMLYTGQRRGDAAVFGRQHLLPEEGKALVVPQKSRGKKRLKIPIHPYLADILADQAVDNLTFITTQYGGPYTKESLGNAMKKWCAQAKIAHCSAHGLRKLILTRLAEAGCSAHELAAFGGHGGLQEVERYTKEADQERLAEQALGRLLSTYGEQKMSPKNNIGDNSGSKPLKTNEA